MLEAYRAGGWGMYPTTLMGISLLVVSVLFALRPEARRVPLVLCLWFLTFSCGWLGTLVGIINMLTAGANTSLPTTTPLAQYVMLGFAEALHNLVFALMLMTLALVIVADGALRVWRGQVG